MKENKKETRICSKCHMENEFENVKCSKCGALLLSEKERNGFCVFAFIIALCMLFVCALLCAAGGIISWFGIALFIVDWLIVIYSCYIKIKSPFSILALIIAIFTTFACGPAIIITLLGGHLFDF